MDVHGATIQIVSVVVRRCGCTDGAQERPRAAEWDEDVGEPIGGAPCHETAAGSGVFERRWTKADVTWDCGIGHGKIVTRREDETTVA